MISRIKLYWRDIEFETSLVKKTTIIGENGAGKSTLLKILTAAYAGKTLYGIPANMVLELTFTDIDEERTNRVKQGTFKGNVYRFKNNGRFKHLYDLSRMGIQYNVIKFTNTGDARSGIFSLNDYTQTIETEFNKYLLNKLSKGDNVVEFIKRINSKLSVFNLEISSIAPIKAKGNVPVTMLSSGEQFIVLLTVSAVLATDSVLLIDEPENSLHIKWQSEIQSLLENAKCVQTIITTHSPFIGVNAKNLRDLQHPYPEFDTTFTIRDVIALTFKHLDVFKDEHKQIENYFKELNEELAQRNKAVPTN